MNLRSLVGDIVAVVGLDGELRPVGVELAETANGRHPLLGRGAVGQVDLVFVGLELVAGRWRGVEVTAGRDDARAGLLDFVEVDRLGFGLGFGRRGRLRFELLQPLLDRLQVDSRRWSGQLLSRLQRLDDVVDNRAVDGRVVRDQRPLIEVVFDRQQGDEAQRHRKHDADDDEDAGAGHGGLRGGRGG